MSPIPPELSQDLPSSKGRDEALSVVLDRALTVAEYTLERMERTRRLMDLFRCIGWIVVIFVATLILLVILHGKTRSTITELVPETSTDLFVHLMYGLFGAIVTLFAKREWGRLTSTYDRDKRYVGKLTDFLRGAVKRDDFPTRLEWYLFEFRISRFDIGPVDPWIARDREMAAERAKALPRTGEVQNWPLGQVSPSSQSPQTTNTAS